MASESPLVKEIKEALASVLKELLFAHKSSTECDSSTKRSPGNAGGSPHRGRAKDKWEAEDGWFKSNVVTHPAIITAPITSKVSFTHGYCGDGRVTMAMRKTGTLVTVGVAFCSPKEQFRKDKGRGISEARLLKALNGEKCQNTFSFNFDLTKNPLTVVGQTWDHFYALLDSAWSDALNNSTLIPPKWTLKFK